MAEEVTEESGDWYEVTRQKLFKKYGDFPLQITSDDEGTVCYHCELCNAKCVTLANFEKHVTGYKHIKKCVHMKLRNALPTEVDEGFPIQLSDKSRSLPRYFCMTCKEKLVGVEGIEKHLACPKHLKMKEGWDQSGMHLNDTELLKIMMPLHKPMMPENDTILYDDDPVLKQNKQISSSRLEAAPGPSAKQTEDNTKYLSHIESFLQHLSQSTLNDREDALLALDVILLLLDKLKTRFVDNPIVLEDLIQVEMHVKIAQAGHNLDNIRTQMLDKS